MRVCLPQWCGEVYVIKGDLHTFIDKRSELTVLLRPTGAPTPYCSCKFAARINRKYDLEYMKERTMSPKNKKIPQYYVASNTIKPSAIGQDYVKFTEKEAVDQARKLVEQDGQERYIVKIIRRVRRKPQPVVVEKV